MDSGSIEDLMIRRFAKITPDMPVVEASSYLIKHELLGSPVTDDTGTLLGWISEHECLQAALQVMYYNQRVATVKDLMRTDVLTVAVTDDVLTLARQMLDAKPKIYPVVDAQGKVLGVVSRRQMLRMLDDRLQQLSKKA